MTLAAIEFKKSVIAGKNCCNLCGSVPNSSLRISENFFLRKNNEIVEAVNLYIDTFDHALFNGKRNFEIEGGFSMNNALLVCFESNRCEFYLMFQ